MLTNIPLGGGQVVCGRGWTTMVPGSAPHSSPRTFVGEHAGEQRERKEAERDTEAHGPGGVSEGDAVGGRVREPLTGGHIKEKRNVRGVWKFLQRGERTNTSWSSLPPAWVFRNDSLHAQV